jgi:hypothetical protein
MIDFTFQAGCNIMKVVRHPPIFEIGCLTFHGDPSFLWLLKLLNFTEDTMKIGRRIIAIIVLVHAALIMGVANAGTINDPDIIVNGQLEDYSIDISNNWYTFSLRANSTVLANGQTPGTSGNDEPRIKIFKSDLSPADDVLYLRPSDTSALDAGDYYMQIFSDDNNDVGTFTISSTQLIPGSGAPSPDYASGYNAGKQTCTDDPTSCGIESGGDFYVIPILVPGQ